jgi:phthiodiolone/phenolphthiodiolone dimycocerosates ketoreductase
MALSTPGLWPDRDVDPVALHQYADPFVAMASCGDVLGDVDVGVAVTDLIRRSAATVAQTTLTVDWAVRGRMLVGVGSGEAANYRPYGATVAAPFTNFSEGTRQLRRLLDEPGPFPDGTVLGLRPRDPARPPQLWLAAHGPRGLRLTGEIADGWLPTQLPPERWTKGLQAVRAAAEAAGRAPSSVAAGLALDVVVADTRAEARRLLEHPVVRASCLFLDEAAFAAHGLAHPLGGSAFMSMIPTLEGERLVEAAAAVPMGLVEQHVVHGDVTDVAAAIRCYPSLEHVRLSDLGATVRPGRGSLARLLAVGDELRLSA